MCVCVCVCVCVCAYILKTHTCYPSHKFLLSSMYLLILHIQGLCCLEGLLMTTGKVITQGKLSHFFVIFAPFKICNCLLRTFC